MANSPYLFLDLINPLTEFCCSNSVFWFTRNEFCIFVIQFRFGADLLMAHIEQSDAWVMIRQCFEDPGYAGIPVELVQIVLSRRRTTFVLFLIPGRAVSIKDNNCVLAVEFITLSADEKAILLCVSESGRCNQGG